MYIHRRGIVTVYIHVRTCLEHKTRKKAVMLQHRHWLVALGDCQIWNVLCRPDQLVVFHSKNTCTTCSLKIVWFIFANLFLQREVLHMFISKWKFLGFSLVAIALNEKSDGKILAFSHTFKPAPKPHEADFLQVQVHSPAVQSVYCVVVVCLRTSCGCFY